MPLMEWTDKLSVGVRVLDDDHRQLVGMLNELFDGMKSGRGREALGPILDRLIQYTRMHFAREERLFTQTAYPAAAAHKGEHEDLTRQVLEVQSKYAKGSNAVLSLDVLEFLKSWLIRHIQGTDHHYRAHLNARGIH
jgi:hemerythrin